MNVAFINKATVPLGVDFSAMVQAFDIQGKQIDKIWGTDPDTLVILDDYTDDYACQIYWDDATQAGALGEHHVTKKGHPIGNVFVKLAQKMGDSASAVGSHEYAETKINPFINRVAVDPRTGWGWAVEESDQTQANSYQINGISVSNWLYPSAFNPKAGVNEKFDHMGILKAPFTIAEGGYANVQVNGQWRQIFSSPQAAAKFYQREAEHKRSLEILSAKKVFASLKLFDASVYPAIPAY